MTPSKGTVAKLANGPDSDAVEVTSHHREQD
jgi:hypothetical protein